MTVSAMKPMAIFISLKYKGKETDQEMNMSKCSVRWHHCFCTVSKYVGNVPSPDIKISQKKNLISKKC